MDNCGYSKLQPTVPGEVFELHGAQKNCGIKTCVRVVGEVFYASGKIRVEVVAPHALPDDDALTAAEQQGHQVARRKCLLRPSDLVCHGARHGIGR